MAVRSITTRLALDGETQFKQAMSSINGALRSLKSELALSEAQFRGQANTVEALAAKDKILRQTLEQQRVKVQALAQALVDAKAVYGDNSAMVDRYQQQLNRAQVELIEMNRALEDNSRYLREAQESTDRTTRSLDEFGNEADDAQDPVDALASALQAAGLVMGLKKIADAIRACTDASKEFESAMASFNKVAKLSDSDLGAMADRIKELSTTIPATTTEIAQVAEASRRLGIAQESLLDFTQVMVDLGNVSDLSADQAATALARFANIVGTSADDYERLGSTIVALGNNFATSESEITNMASRLASAGKLAGLSEAQIMGLAAAMSSVGIEAEAGGTAMTQTLTAMEKAVVSGGDKLEQFAQVAGMSSEQFAQAWQREPIVAVQAFISGLGQLDEKGESATLILEEMGLSGIRQSNMLKSLALASETLAGTLDTANRAWEENTELAATAAERYSTTEAKLQMMDSALNNVKIAVGDALAPALRALADAGTAAFGWVAKFIEDNPILVQIMAGMAAGLAAGSVALAAYTIKTKLAALAQAQFNATLAATPIGTIALAVGGLTAVVGMFAYAADEASSSARELTASMEESRKSMEEQQAASAAQRQDTEALTAQLEELAGKEHRTAAEKEQLLEITRQLNEAIPELGLSYDKLTDSLNMTTDQVLALARAQADAQERQELAQAIVQNEKDQAAAVQALEKAQDRLTAAIERRNAAIESGNYDSLGAEHAIELANGVSQAEKEVADLEEALAQSQAQAAEMKAKLDELTGSSEETAGAMDELTGAAGGTDAEWGELIEAAEALEEATLYVTGAQDALTEALKEQKKNGSLSVATTKELIEAGYGAALAIDEETGAVLLDQEAYLALAQAKLQEKIAALETQRQSVQSVSQLHLEKAAADGAANSIWGVVSASLARAAANRTDDIDAQIAALRRAQEALKNYSFNADEAVRRSSAASRKIKTQAEEDLDTYKALKAELDHERAVGLADERSYYERMAEYRDQYLTDEANISEYRKVTEQIYKYDKSLAEREIDLWAEQSDALIDELEERMDSVTRQQDRMEDKLSDYGDLFKMEDGDLIVEDPQKGIDAINAYGDALERLRDRAPTDGLMQQVLGLDVDTATQYANQLLSMTDKEWNEYNAALDTKQKRAAEIAEQFFKDELDTLETKYNDKLKGSLGELKSTSFDSGVDTAQGLIDGLASKEDALYTQAQNMAARVSEILAGAGRIPSNSELAASFAPERFQEQYLGVTPRDMQNASAGVVNGVSAAMAGQGFDAPLNITIQTEDKTTIARAFVPSIRQASKEDPEVMDDR